MVHYGLEPSLIIVSKYSEILYINTINLEIFVVYIFWHYEN